MENKKRMNNFSKKQANINNLYDKNHTYNIEDAINILNKYPAKFEESIDISINLGIDTKKSDQIVRGSIVLPHGTGKKIRVAVFAEGQDIENAKLAGADFYDLKILSEDIKNNKINFDIAIATPDAMKLIMNLAPILGPKGLMPNPKLNTVTKNIKIAVQNAKAGQIFFKSDKNGIIHSMIGKINFSHFNIKNNLQCLISEIKKLKPKTTKGTYIKKIVLSSTMGPGLILDINSFNV